MHYKIQRMCTHYPGHLASKTPRPAGKITSKAAFLVWGEGGGGTCATQESENGRNRTWKVGVPGTREREAARLLRALQTPRAVRRRLHAGPSRPGFDSKTPPGVQLEQVVSSTPPTFPPGRFGTWEGRKRAIPHHHHHQTPGPAIPPSRSSRARSNP